MLRGFVDGYAMMGAPEEDVSRCRQDVDAAIESLKRLNDWRQRNSLPFPAARGLSVD